MTITEQQEKDCGTCGRKASTPRKVIREGVIVECCVDVAHDAFVAPGSEHAGFVQQARDAGITGVC